MCVLCVTRLPFPRAPLPTTDGPTYGPVAQLVSLGSGYGSTARRTPHSLPNVCKQKISCFVIAAQASSTTTYHIWLDAPQHIRQNVPYFTGREVQCISAAMEAEDIRSSGNYSTSCQRWLREHMGAETVLLTGSGTTALEQAALLCDFQPGDEVIMPSFTFVSTANAFVLRGATPVFVVSRPGTRNTVAGEQPQSLRTTLLTSDVHGCSSPFNGLREAHEVSKWRMGAITITAALCVIYKDASAGQWLYHVSCSPATLLDRGLTGCCNRCAESNMVLYTALQCAAGCAAGQPQH